MEPPAGPKIPKTFKEKDNSKRVIVILEHASLETVKSGKEYHLLNCDEHINQLVKAGRDPAEERPDIVHQCLLMLLDSPLNKAGLLQVYIQTKKGVLIEVNPQTRIPRTFKRFAGLMVQLLQKFSIRATNGPEKLLKVIKNPITDHLPSDCRKIRLTETAKQCTDVSNFVTTLPQDRPTVFVIGAFAKGKLDVDFADTDLAISQYSLSAAVCCSKVCTAFEQMWKIL